MSSTQSSANPVSRIMTPANHVSQLPSSYIREILAVASSSDCISFAGGLPSSDHFPLGLLTTAIQMSPSMPALFQYGTTSGLPVLIEFLTEQYRLSHCQSLLITNGSQQGIDLVARSFLNPGDEVLMESPSYLGAIQAFLLSQARIKTVKQTNNGPDLQQLEQVFSQHKIKVFYCVPDFHNPSGVCWSLKHRHEVIRLCSKHKVMILEDAPYRDLRFKGEDLPTLFSLNANQVIRLNSFSKTAMPGLRLGCVYGQKKWLNIIEKVKQASDLHTNLPNQHLLYSLLSHPEFPTHLDTLRQLYRQRYQVMKDCLQRELSDRTQFTEIQGGMFIWIELCSEADEVTAKKALSRGVAVVPGSAFFAHTHDHPSTKHYLRLNFSCNDESTIEDGVTRLRDALS